MAPPTPRNSGRLLDFRSDTVTRPTDAMRQAAFEAEVGDDVYGEDPTVNRLQEYAAKIMGKEAALLVPTGTMGNLSAVLAHCPERGTEVLLGDNCHIYNYEGGGISALGGLAFHVMHNEPNGEILLEDLQAAIRPDDAHCSRTGLVCLESSHNRCGGTVLSLEYMATVKKWADSLGIPVHLDGARVFNAAEALGVSVGSIAAHVTTIQFCLSKGMGAPIGSMVAGPKDFIARVRKYRKMLGGGMRQAGIIAAPGMLALKETLTQLPEDHANARILARGLAKLPLVSINLDTVETNIIIFQLKHGAPDKAVFLRNLRERHGVLMSGFLKGVRAVTHFDVTAEDCKYALMAVEECLQLGEVHSNGEMNGKARKELHQNVNGSLKGYE